MQRGEPLKSLQMPQAMPLRGPMFWICWLHAFGVFEAWRLINSAAFCTATGVAWSWLRRRMMWMAEADGLALVWNLSKVIAAAPESDKRPVIGKWKLRFSSLLKGCFKIKGVWQKKRLSVPDARICCLQPWAQPRSVLAFCILQNHEQTCNMSQMWRMHIEYFLNFWLRYHFKRTYLSPVMGMYVPLLWGCGCWRCCCFFQAEAVKKDHSWGNRETLHLEAFLARRPETRRTYGTDLKTVWPHRRCWRVTHTVFLEFFCEDVGTTVCIPSAQQVLSLFERLKTFENLQPKQLKTKVPNLHFKLESEVYAIVLFI